MDPLVTIVEIDEAIERQDFGVAIEHIVAYYEWRLQGGLQLRKNGVAGDELVKRLARTLRETAWAPPARGKFTLGETLDSKGDMVPAWGFDFHGMFIVNATVSECGRFEQPPAYFGLTQEEVDELQRLNAGRGLL